MRELTGMLAAVMGRTVIDKIGITETFDVNLEFTPDESLTGLPRPPGPGTFIRRASGTAWDETGIGQGTSRGAGDPSRGKAVGELS